MEDPTNTELISEGLEPETPQIAPPPVLPPPAGGARAGVKKKASWLATAALFIAAKAKVVWTFLVLALKFGSFGKILLTSGSMLFSVALYSLAFGWPFAVGFVICIFIHEMGHVFVGWRQGLPMSAPVFIPFMGAVIFNKRGSSSAWGQAIMGIGGPIGGTLAGLACWAIFAITGNMFFLALAYVTFFMNLFNLLPVPPLDGGWITGAVSPYIWIVGLVAMIAGFVMGYIRNPLVIVLVVLSLPRLWASLRSGKTGYGGVIPALPHQRLLMGFYYVGLAAFLFSCMRATNIENFVRRRQGQTYARIERNSPRPLGRLTL